MTALAQARAAADADAARVAAEAEAARQRAEQQAARVAQAAEQVLSRDLAPL